MKEIIVAKFEPLQGQVAEDTVIKIIGKVPDIKEMGGVNQWLENAKKFYDEQADAIADALFNSLPQGTLDRIWIALMKRKMSLYAGKTEG